MNSFEELKDKLNKVKIVKNNENTLYPQIFVDGTVMKYSDYEFKSKGGELAYLTITIPCELESIK